MHKETEINLKDRQTRLLGKDKKLCRCHSKEGKRMFPSIAKQIKI